MAGQATNNEKTIKRDKLTRDLYVLPNFGGATFKGYFDSYLAMLLTDIYMIPLVLSGILEMIKTIVEFAFSPIFGAFLDRVTLRKGKYWQWIIIGSIGAALSYMILFALPALTSAPEKLGFFVFVLSIILAVFLAMVNVTVVSLYPRLAPDPKIRTHLSVAQKIGRDGGKTLWGYVAPALLILLTAKTGSEAGGWATTGLILGTFGVICYLAFASVLRGTSMEQDAIAAKSAVTSQRKPKVPLKIVVKGLFTNRALLVMFLFMALYKTFYFFQVMSATYFFKYVAKDFASLGIFMLAFNLSAVVGVICGLFWVKIFKDSKKAFVAGGVVQIIILLIATLTFNNLTTGMFIAVISCASFFGGIVETYIMPMFAAAADYGAWKTGERTDGLSMSLFSVSVRVGMTFSTLIRTALLATAGYNAAAYVNGVGPSQDVIGTLINLQTILPLIFAVVCFGLVAVLYPLNDKKLARIKEEIEAGRVGENADMSILN